jgi:hypothetical protein
VDKMNELLNIKGRLKVDTCIGGVFTEGEWKDNVITTLGKNALATFLNGGSAANLVTHMGFGTSATAVAAADTALGAELAGNGYARVAVTKTNPTANVAQYVATLTGITAATTVQEAGLFNQAATGTLFAHQLTGAVALQTAQDSLQITWQVTIN